MKSLLDRLKPDYAELLRDHRERNPDKVEDIEKDLSSVQFVIEIPYRTIVNLYWLSYHAGLPFDMTNAWDLFEDYKAEA